MAAGAVDFLRGLLGWWSGDGSTVTPPDTVDIVYSVGGKRPYYSTSTRRPFWKAQI
jgi:hypothetical protein